MSKEIMSRFDAFLFVDFKRVVAIEFRYEHGRRLTVLLLLPFKYEVLRKL